MTVGSVHQPGDASIDESNVCGNMFSMEGDGRDVTCLLPRDSTVAFYRKVSPFSNLNDEHGRRGSVGVSRVKVTGGLKLAQEGVKQGWAASVLRLLVDDNTASTQLVLVHDTDELYAGAAIERLGAGGLRSEDRVFPEQDDAESLSVVIGRLVEGLQSRARRRSSCCSAKPRQNMPWRAP